MFEKLFKDIPKSIRLFTRIYGILGIIGAALVVFVGLIKIGDIIGLGSEGLEMIGGYKGFAMTGLLMFGELFGTFLLALLKYLLIILAGEIVARVYLVWENKSREAFTIDDEKIE